MLNQKLQAQKARKQKIARFIQIGELAEKAGIDQLAPEILMGAFQRISQIPQNHPIWYQTGCALLKDSNTLVFIPVANNPTSYIINKLRTIKFFFDPFHNLFFGPANNKNQAEMLLKLATHEPIDTSTVLPSNENP